LPSIQNWIKRVFGNGKIRKIHLVIVLNFCPYAVVEWQEEELVWNNRRFIIILITSKLYFYLFKRRA